MRLSADPSFNVDPSVMLAASIQLKNLVKDSWKVPLNADSAEKCNVLSSEDRAFVKSNLLLFISSSKELPIIKQLEAAFFSIADKEFPEGWPELLKQMNEGLQTAREAYQFRAVIVSLKNMVKMYRYKCSEQQEIVMPFIDEIYCHSLYNLSAKLVTANTEAAAELLKYIACSFYFYISYDLSTAMTDTQTFDKWLELFQLAFTWPHPFNTPVTNPEEAQSKAGHPVLKMKSAIAQIFYVIFKDYGNPNTAKDQHYDFCLHVQKKYVVGILNIALSVLKASLANFLPPKLISASFSIVREAIPNPCTTELLKPLLLEFLCQVGFRYLLLNEHVTDYWRSNQGECIQGMLEESDECELRKMAMMLIELACKYKGYDQGVMQVRANQPFLNKFIDFLEFTLSESVSHSLVLEFEASLFALGSLARTVEKYPQQSDRAKALLFAFALPALESSSWVLRARSSWLFSQFALMYFKESDKVLLACWKLLGCFNDEYLAVRVIAAVAVSRLAEKPYVEERLKEKAMEIISAVMWLMTLSEESELVSALKLLIATFRESVVPHSYNLIQHLIEAYKRMSKLSMGESKDLSSCLLMEIEVSAGACLDIIAQILSIIKNNQQVLLDIEPLIISAVNAVLDPEEFPFIESGMEILGYLTLYQDHISDSVWKLVPELIDLVVGSPEEAQRDGGRGFEVVNKICAVFQNIIVKGGDKFASGKFERGSFVNATLHLAKQIIKIADFNGLEYRKPPAIYLIIAMLEGLTVLCY